MTKKHNKKKNLSYYKFLYRKLKKLILLILVILFFSIILNAFQLYNIINLKNNNEKQKQKYFENRKIFQEILKNKENIVFLGDSITFQYDLKKYYKNYNVVNSGVDGNRIEDILDDLDNRVYNYNPSKVFILIGTNNLAVDENDDEIIKKIEELLIRIKENKKYTDLYFESILPINNTEDEKIDKIMVGNRNNERIKFINQQIEIFCDKNEIVYIDLYAKLIDKNDNLDILYTKEGLHISEDGYDIITKEIKKYL